MCIRIVEREEVAEDAAHVELDVGNSRSLYVTVADDCTSVVLADSGEEKQASIAVEDGTWSVRGD